MSRVAVSVVSCRGVYRLAWLLSLVVVGPVTAAELDGTYRALGQPSLELRLREDSSGVVTGTLSEAGDAVPLTARRTAEGFVGSAGDAGSEVFVVAVVNEDALSVALGGLELMFRRLDSEEESARDAEKTAGSQAVVVNGEVLDEAALAGIEQRYGVRIDAAEYWYDPALGAWGLLGGPALGFIMPGLELGGPLAADASGNGTSVFVNGRALHPVDLVRLQTITGPIAPGRYFLLANGLAGFEGGPPLWNLLAMAPGAANAGNSSNTWQSRLSSGFSDGTTGAVFLPNGGIVSTGQ